MRFGTVADAVRRAAELKRSTRRGSAKRADSVHGDPTRLQQIVENLLRMQSSSRLPGAGGSCRATARELGRDRRRDTGIVSPDVLARIFAPFEQAEDVFGAPPRRSGSA
jgi:hypothetical protein